jgi:hypothetical protein
MTTVAALATIAWLGLAEAETEWFVAVDGSDVSAGTKSDPFATLQRCVDRLLDTVDPAEPGSTCWLRGGEYNLNTSVDIEALHGNSTHRYVISGWEDEQVILDGTWDVNSVVTWSWTEDGAAGHWVATLPAGSPAPWQLFVDGEPMVNARWPNAWWENKTMFTSDSWVGSEGASTYNGYSNPSHATYSGDTDPTVPCIMASTPCAGPFREACAGNELGASGINATGASAVLNIGHWVTYAAPVRSHTPGSDNFTYMAGDGWKVTKFVADHSGYYLENSLELLDIANEWHYDNATRQLHLKTHGDVHPSTMRVQARQLEYAIRITDTTHLVLQKMKLFSCTVWAFATRLVKRVQHVEFASLHFAFPAAMKRMLGNHVNSWPTTLFDRDTMGSTGNRIFNCTFFGGEADPLLQVNGAGIHFEDNLMEWNDWSAVTTVACWPAKLPNSNSLQLPGIQVTECDDRGYGGGAFALVAPAGTITNPTVVRRNTLRHIGPSAGIAIAKNSIAELNHST